jgi:hypothetical protein
MVDIALQHERNSRGWRRSKFDQQLPCPAHHPQLEPGDRGTIAAC